MRLDAVRIQIDGQLVAHYIYSFKELEALQQGRRAADLRRQRHRPGSTSSRSRRRQARGRRGLQPARSSFTFQQGRRAEAGRTDAGRTRFGPARRSSSGTGRCDAGRHRGLLGLGLAAVLAAGPAVGQRPEGPLFRRGALSRLPGAVLRRAAAARHRARASITVSTSRSSTTLHYHINDAEFSVGDFELNYRMHHRAGRAIKAVLEGDVDEAVRNEAAFRLARIHFQKDQLDDALHALERIQGEVPEADHGRRRVPARERLHGARAGPRDAVEVLAATCSAPRA